MSKEKVCEWKEEEDDQSVGFTNRFLREIKCPYCGYKTMLNDEEINFLFAGKMLYVIFEMLCDSCKKTFNVFNWKEVFQRLNKRNLRRKAEGI